ncbi:hypothetical protein CEY16_06700 [Halalkalibacillus sediminis]|uniref:DUF4870 domain-containing protein n=1 Tax=Halalkalibacillus sediminis TaxID=2018042 RepID=A0A2I0QU55_9BACI|nr:hypothetical protein [Halalkalibacillus sediminis]PKR77620.1 hypothetical protein CEY16_06700 [Halalkalibacillus sediminis]
MSTEEVLTHDVEQDRKDNKAMAIIAYLGIFVIVPLLAAKDSRFAMYHANQGLILFIFAVVLYTIGSIIPILGWLLILPLTSLLSLVLAIMGIINAANEKEKPLPLIGKYTIIQYDKLNKDTQSSS